MREFDDDSREHSLLYREFSVFEEYMMRIKTHRAVQKAMPRLMKKYG